MTTQHTTFKAGDRVQITAAQSYEITWDDNGDRIIGEYGVLQEVSTSALADNTATGTYDSTPYKVCLDSDEEVWAADVMSETDGLRRTIAELDKSLDDRWKRIEALETELAAPRILTDAEYEHALETAWDTGTHPDEFALDDAVTAALVALGIYPPAPEPTEPAPDTVDGEPF